MTTHDSKPLASRPSPSRPRRSAGVRARAAACAVALVAVSTSAVAVDRVRPERLTVYADVIDVRPVYREARHREPRRECWIEEQRHVVREGPVRRIERHDTYRDTYREKRGGTGDVLVGGVIGGVIGNQLGRNSSRGGRTGATIAGAIVGSAVANEASARTSRHRREPRYHYREPRTVYETRPVERCRTVETSRSEQRLQHYDVTYRYEGRRYTTRLRRDPGPTLELEVTVRPARH